MDKRTKIVNIIRSFATEPIDPSPQESLFDSGLLDSFSLADLVSALEKEFAIQIPDADLQPRKFDSVERIEAYVESRM
jgi:acyl carrier protein